MGHVDALIGVSSFVVGSLVENGYDAARTHAVLNAVDLPLWNPQLDGTAVRQEFGIPGGAPVIACAGRMFKGKGQDDVIRALPAVCREFPGVRLLIVGRDDRQVMRTSFTAELKTLAAELGVSSHVIYTGQRSDMPAVMAACDVFALPSQEEPFGLVFVEAMAMKKPVVALNNGGAPEVVDHGQSGLLSAQGDVDALAANLLTLLRDPHLRARMGEFGRTQAETRFTAQRLAGDVARVYRALAPAVRVDGIALAGRRA
jgi:glycosyltransferase involved in cell wall biosynthesis